MHIIKIEIVNFSKRKSEFEIFTHIQLYFTSFRSLVNNFVDTNSVEIGEIDS